MANTCNIFLAVAFLASLSLSAGLVRRDHSVSKDYENFNYEVPLYLREKREIAQDSHENKHDAALLEKKLSESQNSNERRSTEEDVEEKSDVKIEEQKKTNSSNKIEKDNQDEFAYRSMQDLIHALILADEEDIAMRLQQLNKLENTKESEKPKRQIGSSAAAAAAASAGVPKFLGMNMWDVIPIEHLDSHSCEAEALGFGHFHTSGLIVHEFFCELRKFWHYFLVVVRNFKSALTLGPLIAEEIVAGDTIGFLHQIPRILEAVVAQPRHLLLLPEIIHDCVPFPSIFGAIHRIRIVAFKVFNFVRHLILHHVRNFFRHIITGHQLGVHLLERLARLKLEKQHLLASLIPFVAGEISGEPGFEYSVPAAASAAAASSSVAAASAATAAASSATVSDGGVAVPDYYESLGEILNSFRGFYNGYQASGIPHFIRTGVKNFAWSSTISTIKSYLFSLPFFNGACSSPVGPAVVEEDTVTTTNVASASASASVSDVSPVIEPVIAPPVIAPIIEPVIEPIATPIISPIATPVIAPIAAPVAPVVSETASASASASASSTIIEKQPVIYSEPIAPVIEEAVPVVAPGCETAPVVVASETATATAAASSAGASAASSSAAVSSPVVSGDYQTVPQIFASPVIGETYAAPQIVSNPVEEIISETSSSSASASSSSVSAASPAAAFEPEYVVPSVGVDDTAAAASSSAAASASSSVTDEIVSGPIVNSVPSYDFPSFTPRILPPYVVPANAGAAAASASASSSNSIPAAPIRYRGGFRGLGRIPIPYGIPAVGIPSAISSPAAASSSAAAATSAASSSAAATSSSAGGIFNVILPREQIIRALGHDLLLPGDLIAVTLKNKAVLFGRVLDGTSPVTFSFLRPHLRASVLRNSGRIWKLLARDFRDPECVRKFNNPRLLSYAL